MTDDPRSPSAGTSDDNPWWALADELWHHLELYHAVTYFAPEHRAACDRLGLRGGWMAYFASRAAPLGCPPPELVTAVFYNFHASMVARALPDAWSHASPARVLEARYRSVDAALTRILAGARRSETLEAAADVARRVALAADPAGRPMYAANAALPWPNEPHMVLWHAATLLREHRGDGHVATLTFEGIDGCEAHVLQVAGGAVPRSGIQPYRGWSDDDWSAAVHRLRTRGLLEGDGSLSAEGSALRHRIAVSTSRLACSPLRAVGVGTIEQLIAQLTLTSRAVLDAGDIPYPNPMGVPAPRLRRDPPAVN